MAGTNKGMDLSNPPAMRGFSNNVDNFFGWHGAYKNDSSARAFIHGAWHVGAGVSRFVSTGNAGDEFARAGQQFSVMAGRPPSPPPK